MACTLAFDFTGSFHDVCAVSTDVLYKFVVCGNTFSIKQILYYFHAVFYVNVIYIFMCNIVKGIFLQFNMFWRTMYEKQCAMHTLYDCFVNECDPCILFVPYRFLKLSSQILQRIRGASLRQTKIIIRHIHIRYTRFLTGF